VVASKALSGWTASQRGRIRCTVVASVTKEMAQPRVAESAQLTADEQSKKRRGNSTSHHAERAAKHHIDNTPLQEMSSAVSDIRATLLELARPHPASKAGSIGESQAALDEAQATLKKAYGEKQREPHLHPSVITPIAPKLD
jgi:hypothetical protein